jgi:hypothetical protein
MAFYLLLDPIRSKWIIKKANSSLRFNFKPEKGKPFERMGRKATGLNPEISGYGSRAADRK